MSSFGRTAAPFEDSDVGLAVPTGRRETGAPTRNAPSASPGDIFTILFGGDTWSHDSVSRASRRLAKIIGGSVGKSVTIET